MGVDETETQEESSLDLNERTRNNQSNIPTYEVWIT